MKSAPGLRREIIRSLRLMMLGIISLAVIGTYVFYGIAVVLEAFASPLAESGFMLKRELDSELQVCCDLFRIRQALMARLENTRKHALPGLLTVRLHRSDSLCILSLENEGPGISEEVVAYIFDAFRWGDPSRSRKSGGSGLGLVVVKAIAEAYGGCAVCQPTGRGGSRFMLSWPMSAISGCPEK